ncbi:hypothetical protein SK571_38605 [Lentzea sp. BCCO 10_0798]|uniref:Transmembrane protein n=1 Tax=Lentzea kristufekii TaxID=3095430 RepID=A0ABU4U5P4_9PSEU|nr:hypothetical protein [Lentzea sp. BCCO 10_0798]MDX8055321.1 hypothetical protein [Lentzea sp. BCCO 10_0798]
MSRESGSDQTQRTVAELLAQYGGSAESAPRRRRRRADDEEDVQQPETAPQSIIERVLSDSGRLMAIRDDDVPQPGRRAAPEPQAAPPPPLAAERTAYQPKPPPPKAPQPSQQMPVPPAGPPQVRRPAPPMPAPPPAKPAAPVPPPPAAAEQTRQVPQVRDQPSNSGMPRPDVPGRLEARLDQSTPSRTNITRPPKPVPPSVQMPVPGPPREAMTEQLPRIPAKAPVDKIAALETESVLIVPPAPPKLPEPLPGNVPDAWFGDDDDAAAKTDLSMAPMESTAAHPGPYVDDDSQEYAAYRPEDDYLADDDEADEDEGPAGLDDAGEAEEEADAEPRSAGKEWLIMIGQLAVGVLGGAGLWLAFNYLWRSVPAAALVVALAVTVGLVLLVRKIRRADDLQTTVLAVLVGLIVTVSPAAMLLVKS